MKIIDRYLLMQFLKVFVICLVSLTGLYIVIDGFANLDNFMHDTDEGGSLLPIMIEWYAYRSLAFFDLTGGILTLIAAMFTITWIQRHNELTALEAAGLSKRRVLTPVIIAVTAISLLAAANRELVIPRCRGKLCRTSQNVHGKNARMLQQRYDNATNIFLAGAGTVAETQSIIKPDFAVPPELNGGRRLVLSAQRAFYRPPQDDRPGGYLLEELDASKSLDQKASLELDGERVVYTPYDTPWLKPRQCFVASGVSFELLEGNGSQYFSLLELIRGLRNPSLDLTQDVRVAIHSRLLQPVLDITLLFLGLPLVLTRTNRNMFLAIGLSVVLVAWFMGFTMLCQAAGSNLLLSPALAAWLPLMVFIPWAAGNADVLLE